LTIESQITELVQKYRHEDNKAQSEADVRAGYIDRLFVALEEWCRNDDGNPRLDCHIVHYSRFSR